MFLFRSARKLLRDLPANPDDLLGFPVFPYAQKFSLQITALDKSTNPPQRWWLVFVVSRETPGELHVESVRSANDPPKN